MVSQAFRLDGKTALVAGDSRYWTRYAAAALAEAGAQPLSFHFDFTGLQVWTAP